MNAIRIVKSPSFSLFLFSTEAQALTFSKKKEKRHLTGREEFEEFRLTDTSREDAPTVDPKMILNNWDKFGNRLVTVEKQQEKERPEKKEKKTYVKSVEERKRQMDEIARTLEQGVKDVFESENYKKFLACMSKFHTYSISNYILIWSQNPDASLVAGYQAWKKFKRNVKKGEKGIKIFAPAPYKSKMQKTKYDPETRQAILDAEGKPVKETVEIQRTGFHLTTVFDISQTEGDPLPTIGVDELTGDVENYSRFLDAVLKTAPVPVSFEDIQRDAKGFFNEIENRIVVQKDMSETQTLKTLIHEIAHSVLHSGDNIKFSQNEREVQAESVAYVVCSKYGIDTSDYSFGYIAGWSSGKEVKELEESLKVIKDTADDIIRKIDDNLKTELSAVS